MPLFLMLAADKAFAPPFLFEDRMEVHQAERLSVDLGSKVGRDRLVQGRSIDDSMMLVDRHVKDVAVFILERAGEVVINLIIAELERLIRPRRAYDHFRWSDRRGMAFNRLDGGALDRGQA